MIFSCQTILVYDVNLLAKTSPVICSRHPEVKWAEREDKIYLTVLLSDAKNPKVDLDPEGTFTFTATAGTDNNPYEIKLDLLDKVNVEVRACVTCAFIVIRENVRRSVMIVYMFY